jgi:hypothetical protein
MAKRPRKKRITGDEPARGLYSRASSEIKKAPTTNPMISGRMYCTTAARCRPTAPAIALEPGDADAHIGWIAQILQQGRQHADYRSHSHNSCSGRKEIFHCSSRIFLMSIHLIHIFDKHDMFSTLFFTRTRLLGNVINKASQTTGYWFI